MSATSCTITHEGGIMAYMFLTSEYNSILIFYHKHKPTVMAKIIGWAMRTKQLFCLILRKQLSPNNMSVKKIKDW